METVEFYVDTDGFPWTFPRNWHRGKKIRIPVEIEECIIESKLAIDEVDYASGIVADWMEENRELLHQLNPDAHDAVDRMTTYFRRMWQEVGK